MSRPPTRRRRRGAAAEIRRDELLQVAREVFSASGFEGAGMRDIADRFGLLAGSLYYYVDSKQALLGEVMRALQAPSMPLLEAATAVDGPVPEQLEHLLRIHTEAVAADPLGVTLVFTELRRLTDEQRAEIVHALRRYKWGVEDLVRRGQREGTFSSRLDSRLSAMAILGAVNWTSRWVRPDGRYPPAEVGRQLASLVLDGFAAHSPGPDAVIGTDIDFGAGVADDRRSRVMQVAAELFNRDGYEATAMSNLAAAVGIGKASIYHYFPTKEQLLFAIAHEAQQYAEQQVMALSAASAPALTRLRAVIRFHVRYVAAKPDSTSLVLHGFRSLSPEHRAVMRTMDSTYTGLYRGLVDAVVREGAGREDLDPAVVTRGVLGMVNWLYRWYRPGGAATPEQIAELFSDIVTNGLRPRESRPDPAR